MLRDAPLKIQQALRALHWSPTQTLEPINGHMHSCCLAENMEQGRFVVKFADRREDRDFLRHEHQLLKVLEENSIPVPHVLAYLEGEAQGDGILILEFIDAPNGDQWLQGQNAAGGAAFYRAMGQSLRALHALPLQLITQQPKARPRSSIIDKGLKRAAPFLRNVDSVHSQLMGELTRYPIPSTCLLHRDFRERNLLVQSHDDSLKLTMLDFEWASVGDPFFDLAGSRLPFSKFSHSFLAGYTNDRGLNEEEWRRLRFYAALDLLDVFTRQDELTVDITGLIYKLTKPLKKHLAALRESP